MEKQQVEELFHLLKKKGYNTRLIFQLIKELKKAPVIS